MPGLRGVRANEREFMLSGVLVALVNDELFPHRCGASGVISATR